MGDCRRCVRQDCYECLNYIHHCSNKSVHYQCEKITYNYVLKHGHRYSSEIYYAVKSIASFFEQKQMVSILSIGCGPSTELYGAIAALNGFDVNFVGLDKNPIWGKIQQFNISSFVGTSHKVCYENESFDVYMDRSGASFDILVLNYFLSDIIKFDKPSCDTFLQKLVGYINGNRFRFIVINDIPLFYNQGTGYSCMEKLANQVKNKPYLQMCRRHFADPNQFQFPYGTKKDDALFFKIQENISAFEPFGKCGSIQLIIKV